MNYRLTIEFRDEDGADPLTEEEVAEAVYNGRFPSRRREALLDIQDLTLERY